MPNKVRHLRATDAEWAENDAIIDDGEIALAKTPAGNYRMKIGTGDKPFSELDMFGGEVKKPSTNSIRLMHGDDVRYTTASSLSIFFENNRDEDYYSMLTFDSGETATKLTYPKNYIKFSGISVQGGEFVPEANMHYTVAFWEDGTGIQAHIRGLQNNA